MDPTPSDAPALPPLAEQPGVSYVMPVLNEAGYIESAVASILAQGNPGESELVLALGPSTDGTDAIVQRLAAAEPRIRIVDNPQSDIPIGLNRAIAASSHPVIVRVDAHTELAEGYTLRGVETLRRTGAASLGGVMQATGRPGVQAAVARAYNSRFGLGGGAYHGGDDVPEGPAESAYMGIMRREAVDAVGGFDETLRRGEDWEFNHRLRRAGYLVWLDPKLEVTYWPRSTFARLARQFLATGIWRGELVRRLGGSNPVRFFAPPVLLLSLVVSVVLLPLHATGVLHGALGWILALAYLGPLAYLALLVLAAATTSGSLADRIRFAGVLAVMHLSWAWGFVVGLLRGARDAVDTSRTES
ncbi:glycosyltransferase family 2 protein [Schumannella sp. 10F1B-5-1]|uniref:glycosyltransferase family 2 protein n=1 Tax=Schumannella sp. 10F1B-5-1 TaxID=2590780 RepID=UPI001131ED3C|nr:glycosyltransferase family 2 protein [Schumannella sp. 10F1B-5-1]TPW73170.1 glycosyltransferase family 2 protein [Schumannella sp. 10F1B-5-1]